MAQDEAQERYKAFISYSQKDSAEAGKVQSWLESFRLPKANATLGKDGRKLGKIFRDTTDLTASPEVWPALQAKIAASEYLIVLCSPNAAQSEWVDKEIRHFRASGRADEVLALIIAGTPNSGDEATECFPPAFRETEPLAANLVLDGRASALTRIVAGLAGVPFDALWQRERRRQRRQMAIGGGLVTLGLTLTAAALVAGWFAASSLAAVERQSSNLMAREAKGIFNSEAPDIPKALLMALQADPTASRSRLRYYFDGEEGYLLARARMEAGVSNNRLEQVYVGHTEAVNTVALTGDGHLITGSRDGTARIWNLETGDEIRVFDASDYSVDSASLTEHGRLVTVSIEGTKIWDRETGEELKTFYGQNGIDKQVALLEVGRVIAAFDHRIQKLWDLETGEAVGAFYVDRYHKAVSAAPVGEDSLVTGSANGMAHLWDLETGEITQDYIGHLGSVNALAVTGDGRLVTGSDDRTARLWDLETGEELRALVGHQGSVNAVAITPDGRLVTGSSDRTARLWDLETGEEIRTIASHSRGISSVALTRDGHLVTASFDGAARLWDLEMGDEVHAFEGHLDDVNAVALVGDRRLVTGSSDRTARLWDLDTGAELRTFFGHRGKVNALALTGDGRLITGSDDRTARLWDLESGAEISVFPGHDRPVMSVAMSGTGHLVAGSGSILNPEDSIVRLWDLETGQAMRELARQDGPVFSIVLTGDGRIITTNKELTQLWSLETGRPVDAFVGHEDWVSSVLLANDGSLVSGSFDGTARRWDLETGEEIASFVGHDSTVSALAVTANNRLVTGSYDKTARLWDLETGEEIAVFSGHDEAVEALALTEGGLLITGSRDDTVRLWTLPRITSELDLREKVRTACQMLHDINAPLWFTRADLSAYPVLEGEPRVDPDDPNSDFVSPCRCFLPDEVFERPANKCPEGLPGGN
ncbi:MAG: TIR domain-containing protein [Pseudomonadota bacterium]